MFLTTVSGTYFSNAACITDLIISYDVEGFAHNTAGDCLEHELVLGCTDDTACNYDESATGNNGTCEYINNWFLGEIPPSRLTNLFTEGGELYDPSNNRDFQGWYHIHGASNLPANVAAGSIMAGSKYWMSETERPSGQPGNFLLIPYDVDRMLYYQHMETSLHEYNLKSTPWSSVLKARKQAYNEGLEDQNLQSIEEKGSQDNPYIIKIH